MAGPVNDGARVHARCDGLSHDDQIELAARAWLLRCTAWEFVELVAAGDVGAALAIRDRYYEHFETCLRLGGVLRRSGFPKSTTHPT